MSALDIGVENVCGSATLSSRSGKLIPQQWLEPMRQDRLRWQISSVSIREEVLACCWDGCLSCWTEFGTRGDEAVTSGLFQCFGIIRTACGHNESADFSPQPCHLISLILTTSFALACKLFVSRFLFTQRSLRLRFFVSCLDGDTATWAAVCAYKADAWTD